MIGHAGIPATRKRRYLCSQKETLHTRPQRCPNRTVQAELIENLVWESVSNLLSEPQNISCGKPKATVRHNNRNSDVWSDGSPRSTVRRNDYWMRTKSARWSWLT